MQWIARIQALRETETIAEGDDLTQDLVAAFRFVIHLFMLRVVEMNLNSLIYRVFDRDNNGYITIDELQRAMQMIGENVTDAQLNDLLTLADLDKDGRINYEGESNCTIKYFEKFSTLANFLPEFARLLL